MKPILIILNGLISDELNQINPHQYQDIICADGAINKIDDSFTYVKKVFGDLDSITNFKDGIEYIKLPDQNFTDFEKILLYYQNKSIHKFEVIGGSGNEQDHFIGHLSIAKKFMNDIQLLFFDMHHEYFVTDKNTILNQCKNKIISVIPLPDVKGLTYQGMEYPLKNASLNFGEMIGTRNKGISDIVEITFDSGCIVIFKER